ncbi:MAG TPA: Rrf2 family transcriptional regulator [Fibrobacteraceae bacterium]|nr:Rrf2 family transcriptional regulator [Fibrobacteraceae bacterium]
MINRTTETAFRILIDLGQRPSGEVVSLGKLHRRVGGSQTYLAKVTASLVRGGLVRSSRGAQGGVTLARAMSEIRMLDVVSVMQGLPEIEHCECTLKEEDEAFDGCAYHHALEEIRLAILNVLQSYTVAQFVASSVALKQSGKGEGCRMMGPFLQDTPLVQELGQRSV